MIELKTATLPPFTYSLRCSYPTAINMLASGQINVRPLVTHRFPMEETEKAFALTRSGAAVKVMLKCDPDDQGAPEAAKK